VAGLISRDGWTFNNTYDQALEMFAELREEGLKSLTGKERQNFEVQTRWAEGKVDPPQNTTHWKDMHRQRTKRRMWVAQFVQHIHNLYFTILIVFTAGVVQAQSNSVGSLTQLARHAGLGFYLR